MSDRASELGAAADQAVFIVRAITHRYEREGRPVPWPAEDCLGKDVLRRADRLVVATAYGTTEAEATRRAEAIARALNPRRRASAAAVAS